MRKAFTQFFNSGVLSSLTPSPSHTIPSPLAPLAQCERGTGFTPPSPTLPPRGGKGVATKGFTLVELIVVITILVILGTISFISLQNYSKEARDSKRITDVRSLLTKLNVENVKGTPYADMLTDKEDYTKQIDGIQKPVTSGIIDFEYLREARENFKDPEYGIDYDFACAKGVAQFEGNNQEYNFIEGRYWSERNNQEVILGNYYKYQTGDTEHLFTGSLNISMPNCNSVLPNIANIITNVGSPTEINQSWQNIDESKACYYTCDISYEWSNLSKTECVQSNYAWEYTEYTICNPTTPILGSWENCSVTNCGETGTETRDCTEGTGTQTRTVICKNTISNTIVSDTLCDNQTKEELTKNCQSELCGTVGYETSQACNTAPCAVNAECGTANNQSTYTKPTINLCKDNSTPTVTANLSNWTWECPGEHGGTTATCQAPLKVDGVCGTSNGTNSRTIPSTNLCANDTTPSSIQTNSTSWTWTCEGLNGGTTSSTCKVDLTKDGVCGTANNTNSKIKPTTNLCADNSTPTVTTNSTTWTWICSGTNDGANSPTCTTNIMIDGACKTGTITATAPTGQSNLCTSGTANPTTATANGNNWTWKCTGTNGGTEATCTIPRAYCNTSTPTGVGINTTTVGTPTSSNQAWALGVGNCGYTCKTYYSGTNCATFTPPKGVTQSGNDIIVSDGVNSIIIQDRNVGATEVYSGTEKSSVRGHHFQWGRNIGFTSATTGILNSAQSPIAFSTKEKNTNFIWNTSLSSNRYDWSLTAEENAWGGINDTTTYTDVSTIGDGKLRQGPCDSGYHVPSTSEWRELIKIWFSYKGASCDVPDNTYCSWTGNASKANFMNELKIPYSGARERKTGIAAGGNGGVYWTSTPTTGYSGDSSGKIVRFYSATFNYIYPQTATNRAVGLAIRCFKN